MSKNNRNNSTRKGKVKNFFSTRNIILIALVVCLLMVGVVIILRNNGNLLPAPINIHKVSSEEIVRGDTSKQQIIFTFDGGSGLQSGDKILEVLAKHNVKGTFFMTGKFVETYPEFTRKVVAAGHEVFNHTYSHPHLPTLTDKEIISEFDRMDRAFIATTKTLASSTTTHGISTRPYFRPPYGDRDAHVREVAAKNGYQDVYWTVDAHDWKESEGVPAEEVRERIMGTLANGNIYLMHIGDNITGQILDDVFSVIEEKGYRIVSLTEGL